MNGYEGITGVISGKTICRMAGLVIHELLDATRTDTEEPTGGGLDDRR